MIGSRKDSGWKYDSTDRLKEVQKLTRSGFDDASSDTAYKDYINGRPENVRVLFGENATKEALKPINARRADIFTLDIDPAAVILKSIKIADNIKPVGE